MDDRGYRSRGCRGVMVGDDSGVMLGNGRGVVGKVDFCGVVWWRKKNPKKIQRVC